MDLAIFPISLPLPMNVTTVNCYLLRSADQFYLVDTGMTNARKNLLAELERYNCNPGALKLILLTHGDFDHTGNAVYLREHFGAQIAMHRGDSGMLENGDMFWNRKFKNGFLKAIMKTFMPFKAENQGSPDIYLEDGTILIDYGIDAKVYNLPGHSTGSICLLTSTGDLFAGDLLTSSRGKPMLNSMLYDKAQGITSFEKLRTLPIKMIYPGHGKPFTMDELLSSPDPK